MRCILLLTCVLFVGQLLAQDQSSDSLYTLRKEDPYGIGKWYMGREIAHVMGFHGVDWLERPEREQEEKTSKLLKNLGIQAGDVIADIGAGSGYHVFKIAPLAVQGKIYAVDIQDEMLVELEHKKAAGPFDNVSIIKGTEQSANLPPASLDKVLMVDVYHEFNFPREMMTSIVRSLKPNGKVYLIEYRLEDEWVPIKPIHKMSKKQAVKEMAAVGLELERNMGNLPWQHCMVFRRLD